MNRWFRTIPIAWALMLVLPARAPAVKIGDITHLQGCRPNRIVGFGLVVGLNGTGDGGKFAPTMRSLAQLYQSFRISAVSLDELKNAKNVAIVEVEALLPADGVREGDQVDVKVSSVGAAKSLAGGRLFLTHLFGPNPDDDRVMALASGPVQIADPLTPTVGRIVRGATIEQDWIHNYIALGSELSLNEALGRARSLDWLRPDEPYVTLVIEEPHAEWAVAHTIAQHINEDNAISEAAGDRRSAEIAMAFDPRTVVVRIPPSERGNPAPFLARIENLQLFMPLTEARVRINHAAQSVVITGDAEISPVVITYKGLTITALVPAPPPDPIAPRVVQQEFIGVDPQRKGGARLTDLLEALNQLRVPAPDKIAIIEQLHRTGKLHAALTVEP